MENKSVASDGKINHLISFDSNFTTQEEIKTTKHDLIEVVKSFFSSKIKLLVQKNSETFKEDEIETRLSGVTNTIEGKHDDKKLIREAYIHPDTNQRLGVEFLERMDTIKEDIKINQAIIDYCDLELQKPTVTADEKERLEFRKELAVRNQRNAIAWLNQQKTWVGSNEFRSLLGEFTKEIREKEQEIRKLKREINKKTDPETLESKKNDLKIKERELETLKSYETFKKKTEEMVSCPVNMRIHSFQPDPSGQEEKFIRLAVTDDPRNGWTNLQEMKKIKNGEDPKTGETKDPQDLLNKKRMEIITTRDDKLRKLEDLYSARYALEQLKNPDSISHAIVDREMFLQNKMLQLISTQLDAHPPKTDQTQFNIAQLTLLNPKKNTMDKGWAHNETNQMLDMYEMFNDFNGKKVVFDVPEGKGPYIDLDGNPHFSKKEGFPDELHLNMFFFNLSVQGHTKNDGLQKTINEKGFEDLRNHFSKLNQLKTFIQTNEWLKKHPDFRDCFKDEFDVNDIKREIGVIEQLCQNSGLETEYAKFKKEFTEFEKQIDEIEVSLNKLEDQIKEGKSNYRLAENLTVLLLKMNILLSLSCASAKDRTGFVAARTIQRFLGEHIDQTLGTDLNKEKIKRKFANEVLDSTKPAAQVVQDNGHCYILKVSPFHLPGIKTFTRMQYYLRQALEKAQIEQTIQKELKKEWEQTKKDWEQTKKDLQRIEDSLQNLKNHQITFLK